MYPRLIHIYGPFWVQSYGLMIILGFLVFLLCTYYNEKRRSIINDELFFNSLFLALVSGIVGGRTLYVWCEWNSLDSWLNIFSVWQGGFVVLGTILAIILTLPIYLKWHKVAALEFLDFVSIYAPLMHSITRIGCFLAGCCYGAECNQGMFSVMFTNVDGLAPLNVSLYPTQIYSGLASFFIFLILFSLQNVLVKRGQLLSAFLSLECFFRFFIDFYRGDRGILRIFSFSHFDLSLSEIQIWVLMCFLASFLYFLFISFYKKRL